MLTLDLNGDTTKIDECKFKQVTKPLKTGIVTEKLEEIMNMLESTLPTRLPDQQFRGIINFMKTFGRDASNDSIPKALVS